MSSKPSHLMISGLNDADPYRMSAENRLEKYQHVQEIAEADNLLNKYDIIYIDSSSVYRVNSGGVDAVDVKSERLRWLGEKAIHNPGKLFVVVIWDEKKEWDGHLDNFDAAKLHNVIYFSEKSYSVNHNSFLSSLVDKWRSLSET